MGPPAVESQQYTSLLGVNYRRFCFSRRCSAVRRLIGCHLTGFLLVEPRSPNLTQVTLEQAQRAARFRLLSRIIVYVGTVRALTLRSLYLFVKELSFFPKHSTISLHTDYKQIATMTVPVPTKFDTKLFINNEVLAPLHYLTSFANETSTSTPNPTRRSL